MAVQRLTERFAFSGGKVRRVGDPGHDKPYHVIEGVLLCGPTSLNRRRYRPTAFGKPGDKLYENKPVFIDHTDAGGRKYHEHVGWVDREYRNAAGQPVGDIGIKPTHEQAESVLWDAQHRPQNCGMSHVAECKTTRGPDGWDEVESVGTVESVDIVMGPATTKGFFEHRKQGRPVTTLRAVIEQFRGRLKESTRQQAARKLLLLAEDDTAMGAMLDAPVGEPADGVDPDQAIDDAFKQAMHAQVDALLADSHSLADFLSKCRELFKSRAKIMGKAEPKDAGDSEPPASEGRVSIPGLVRECQEKGYSATADDLGILSMITTKEGRANCIERFKSAAGKGGAETPVSAGRERAAAATVTRESKQGQQATPAFSWQD